MRKIRFWQMSVCLAAAVVLAATVGCGKPNGGGETKQQISSEENQDTEQSSQEEKGQTEALIKLPTSGQNVVQTAVPLVAGEMMGTWEKYGLDVTRNHYVSGPPQLEANPSGDWDIGWIGATAGITGILKYDMQIIGLSGYDYSNVAFARNDSDIVKAGDKGVKGTMGSAAEWKGKNIICGVGTVNYCDLMLTLEFLGLTDEDVNIINMDISTGMQAFLSGEGDVYFASSTYATEVAKKEGFTQIHSMEQAGNGMSGTMIANKDYLKENEDTVVKYLAGSLEVLLWLGDEKNEDQAAQWFVKVMNEDFGIEMTQEDALANLKQIGFKDLAFYEALCETGDDGLTGMQREFKKFFEYHVIIGSQEEADMEQVVKAVDSSYLEKAIKLYKENNQ